MSRRLIVLTGYFLRNIFFSLAGSIYVILTLAYWAIFFPPGQRTPDVDNYILIIGAFGAAMTFLATLTIASRAYRAEHCPLIVRLPSRIEYITAVFSSALVFAFVLQFLVAVLALMLFAWGLFPFDRGRRLPRYIINYSRYTSYFIDYT